MSTGKNFVFLAAFAMLFLAAGACTAMPGGANIVSADLNGNGKKDVVVDFGVQYGVWVYMDNSVWKHLTGATAESMVAADFDGNGMDDLVGDFGDKFGIYVYFNNSQWSWLHWISAKTLMAANIDGNAQKDLVVDFGMKYGVYVWKNNAAWQWVFTSTADILVAADMNGNGKDELIGDLGPQRGIWVYYDDTLYQSLHWASVKSIVPADLDGNGKKELVIDFGKQFGIWVRYNDSWWWFLHNMTAEIIVAADLDGNGLDDLAVDFGAVAGMRIKYNSDFEAWGYLHNLSVKSITSADIDGNGKKDLVMDFGTRYGLYVWINNANYQFVLGSPAAQVLAADMDGNKKDEVIMDLGQGNGIQMFCNNASYAPLHWISSYENPEADIMARGANLPWVNYGTDIGNASSGLSTASARKDLEVLMSQRQNSVVRVWLFCDLRSGVTFNADGPQAFTNITAVYNDMDALLSVAEDNNVKLIPVLFDRTLSVRGDVGDAEVGYHPEVITNPAKKAKLITLFRDQFISKYAGNKNIYAWDILNEPEVCSEVLPTNTVTNQQQWTFIREFAGMIKAEIQKAGSSQLVTSANKERKYMTQMLQYWGKNDVLTLYQFHYYNAMGKAALNPLTAAEKALIGQAPVLVGEVSSTSNTRSSGNMAWSEITEKLDYIYQNGYAGGLFWHDVTAIKDDHYLTEEEWSECANWMPDVSASSYGGSGRRESKLYTRPDFNGALYYHYEDADTLATGKGRINIAVLASTGFENANALKYIYPSSASYPYDVQTYSGADYTSVSSPQLTGYIKTYTYSWSDNKLSISGISFPYKIQYTIKWYDETSGEYIAEIPDSSGKVYIYPVSLDNNWNRMKWGNYVGYREFWGDVLQVYSGQYPYDPADPDNTGAAKYQSVYRQWGNGGQYFHTETWRRDAPGWGTAGYSVEPKEPNHPLKMDEVLTRPHVDPYGEAI